MSLIPDAEEQSNHPDAQNELWLICPICKQPNPAGTLHCKHCWGASLYSVTPVTNEQLTGFIKQRDEHRNRFRLFRNIVIGITAPLLLIGAVLFWAYTFTDLIFKPPTYLSSTSLQGDWAMFRHDPSRTGAIDVVSTNPEGKLKWSFQTDEEIASSPTVVNGIAYFGCRDFNLYAVDIETGQLKWKFATKSFIESSPTVVKGIVYFGSNDGKFYALDAITGEELWYYQTTYVIKSTAAVAGNMVYFGSDDYYVYALDSRTGEFKWKYKTRSHVLSSPVVSQGILYVGSMDNACYAINAETGQFRLRMRAKEVVSSPAVSGNTIYFTSGRYLFAMDGKARSWPREEDLRPWWLQFWAFGLAPPPPAVSGVLWGMSITTTFSNTTPVIDGNDIYTTGDSRVMRIDLETREFDWTYKTGGTIRSSPALANGVIYVGSDDGKLYAINAEDGQPLWDFETGGKINSAPTYANGVVYVTSFDGKLYAIE